MEKTKSVFPYEIVVGLSSKCGIYDNIYNLYIEATAAIEYAKVTGKDAAEGIISFESSNALLLDYPVNEIEAFQDAIVNRDIDRFNTISKYLLKFTEKPEISKFTVLCILYDMINSITKAMIRTEKQYFARYGMSTADEGWDNIQMLREMVSALCHEIAEFMTGEGVAKNRNQIDKIKDYLKAHYCEYEFSLQLLAEKFNMSLSNIGHYFKKNTGITLSEYLSRLKFDEAKKMLRCSDLTVEEIVEKIGYISTSTFIRRFKKDMDMTPGEYRIVHNREIS